MRFDVACEAMDESGQNHTEISAQSGFYLPKSIRNLYVMLLVLAFATPFSVNAAGTVTDKDGKTYPVDVAYYYTAGGRLLFAEDMAGLERTIKTGTCSKCVIPPVTSIALAPKCMTTRVSRLAKDYGFGKPAAFVVYVVPDAPNEWAKAVITEELSANEVRGIDAALTDEAQCGPGKTCIPCFGGCCCR